MELNQKRLLILALFGASLCAQTQTVPISKPEVVRSDNPVPDSKVAPVASPVTVQEMKLQSASLGREVPYRVLLPNEYNSTQRRYPTLYLLHGLTGHYTDFEIRTHLLEYAEHYELLIVLVEGGNSWYTNASDPPQDRFEDYVLKDLIPDVDKNFRTLQTKFNRAIAGSSMGGFGALKFALRSPATFIFAGSFSGALGITRNKKSQEAYSKFGLDKIFGPLDKSGESDNDIYVLAAKTNPSALPYLYLDCGADDAFLEQNRDFVKLLHDQKITYEYHEVPGNHNWQYWDQQLEAILKVLNRHFEKSK